MTATRLLFEAHRIAHEEQRYDTAGDWQCRTDGSCHITVSKMSDARYELLVAIRELIEATLCAERGIKQSAVDEFDKLFEAERAAGKRLADAEPGMDPRAPYQKQHFIASLIERWLADEMSVDWQAYDREVSKLGADR